MKDHLMGYAPAAHEDFREPLDIDFESIEDWAFGIPRRVTDEMERQRAAHRARRRVPLLMVVHGIEQMTQADRETLAADNVPLAVWTNGDPYKRYIPTEHGKVTAQRRLEAQGLQIIADTIEQTRQLEAKMRAMREQYAREETDRHDRRSDIERAMAQHQNVAAQQQYNDAVQGVAMGLQQYQGQQGQFAEVGVMSPLGRAMQARCDDGKILAADQHACRIELRNDSPLQGHLFNAGMCVR